MTAFRVGSRIRNRSLVCRDQWLVLSRGRLVHENSCYRSNPEYNQPNPGTLQTGITGGGWVTCTRQRRAASEYAPAGFWSHSGACLSPVSTDPIKKERHRALSRPTARAQTPRPLRPYAAQATDSTLHLAACTIKSQTQKPSAHTTEMAGSDTKTPESAASSSPTANTPGTAVRFPARSRGREPRSGGAAVPVARRPGGGRPLR